MPGWLFGLIAIPAGLFSMAGAVFDWEWFMTTRRAQFVVDVLGRQGARVFYFFLGLFLVGLGVFLLWPST
jgi:hypothetical protein